jgi:amino acid adenylation domain-containing protein
MYEGQVPAKPSHAIGTDGRADTIHELIADAIRARGDAPAVQFSDERLSFAELDQRAAALARTLRVLGVGPGELVGLYLERSCDMVVALLGTLRAGGAYVPLDPAYPPDRIAYMLEDSQARFVVTQAALRKSLPPTTADVVCVDDPSLGSEAEPLPATPSGDDRAYVIYTSGSTGRPKGVEIPHRAVVNFLRSLAQEPGMGPGDRLLAVTTLSFDIAGLEIYLPLFVGAKVVIASRETASDGRALAALIDGEAITVMQATPATWRLLLDAGWRGNTGLRIFCGGEALPRELARQLLPRCAELWNLYGPTETTIWSTLHRVSPGEGAVPIGHAIANTQLAILDDDRRPVAPGTPGELYIGGAGLAAGYLARPELTAERFIANPLDPAGGSRLYRTGDLVRQRPDGDLEHLGRVDFQVKVRGFRIELGEIEAALDAQPDVRQAVVLVREDVPGDKRLVAYIVPEPGASPSPRDLRVALARSLPDYMVPGLYVFLDAFPLTPNGKVDRQSFPPPDSSQPTLSGTYVEPGTDAERRVAAIWAEVLRIDRVGLHDDFFELGGDSLKVAQVATRIRSEFQVDLPLRAVFENRTVAGLAPVIAVTDAATFRETELAITAVRRGETIPLSFAQERVWFIHQVNPDNLAYNFQSTIAFRGALDVRALERALDEILRRHESYRTSFPTVDGRPVQVVHPASDYSLPVVDFSSAPETAREAAAKGWFDREFQHRFDLARVPLVRWTLLRFAPDHNVLVHMEHHLVHDGWSFNMFLRELVPLYEAFRRNEPSPLAPLPIQFAEFATWQRAWMQGAVSDRQLDYWKARFRTIPPVLDLPTRGPRPPLQSFRGTSLRPEIPLDLCNALRALSRREGSTLFMTMLAGFIALMHRYTGETDVAIGTFFANRRARESESLIGMILNNVVIRATLAENPTVSELVAQIRDVVLEGSAHQDVPFDRVVEAVQPKRDASLNPLFQVMFSFHDEPMPETGMTGLDVKLTPVLSNGSAKFDLGVIGIPHSAQTLGLPQGCDRDGLTMIWEHNTDLFDTATIARMIEHYKILLRGMADDPGQRISALPLMSAREREELVSVWNATAGAYSLDKTLPALFSLQAAQSPDAVAVIHDDIALTYGQLEAQSNRLAHHLADRGVAPGVLVGICVGRSPAMLVGLLGILKAGGAYVPIDPAFPADRQLFMIEDSRLKVLVTESDLATHLPVCDVTRILLDDVAAAVASEPADLRRLRAPGPEDLAYVIYTSGSTGRPKGVRIRHRSLANLLLSMRERPGLGAGDRLFAVTTLSFDIAGLELYLPLLCGASVVIGSRAVVTNGEALAARLAGTGATIMQATPTTWQMLLDSGWSGDPKLIALCGGEALPRALAEQLRPRVRRLWNVYGPTETTIWSTIHEVDATDGNIPIGRPIGNTQVYLLDRFDQLVPAGVTGELCIGGEGLAAGYLDRPELSAEKFIANPFDPDRSPAIYRTGDLARYRPDGRLECLGRTDHQIKLRGFRIELGEIEALLDNLPGVAQSVVVAREDSPGDVRLVGYVVSGIGSTVDPGILGDSLKEQLPDYMVPSAWVVLPSLPLTPNGKVDRRALPAPTGARADQAASYVAPRTPEERLLAEVWATLLGLERIGVRDDFFDVGGHSLLAVRLVARIEARTGIRIPLAALLQGRTIERIAPLVATSVPPAMEGVILRKASGTKSPFFAIGSHPRYAEMPRRVSDERPFYQFDIYALLTERRGQGLRPLESIEELAEHYLGVLKQIRPGGPYHLGGGCEGAYLAYEMAVRLQEAGEPVASLIMWIPPALGESKGLSLRRFPLFLSALRWRNLVARGALNGSVSGTLGVLLEHERIEYSILKALCNYAPRRRFQGRITLVRTAERPPHSPPDIDREWIDRATEGADVRVVPGNHDNWLRDHLDDFTAIVRNRLAATAL